MHFPFHCFKPAHCENILLHGNRFWMKLETIKFKKRLIYKKVTQNKQIHAQSPQ